ncbi:MAG: membrane associated rhomboid family serine protease [Planctomycetota bacterium]|jgi:membrane associated rhomboid family serine protease
MMNEGPRLPQLTPAIKHLMIVNAIVFGLNAILFGRLSAPAADGASGFWFAFSWDLGLEGFGLGFLRLVTYQFTHSFTDAWHFFGNMMVLYFMGTIAEARLGYRGTIKLYLIGGVCGALLHLGLAAVQGYQNVPLVGASGACYSFLVYAACRFPNALVFNIIPLWALAGVLVFIAFYQTFIGLAGGFGGGVAHSAHLGGAVLGFLAFRKNLFVDWADSSGQTRSGLLARMMQNVRQKRAQREFESVQAQRQQMDQILAKVKAEGLASLTPAERKFLERVSKDAQK